MADKRRSMLFPFHLGSGSKHNTEQGKFEVVNRKKAPWQSPAVPASQSTSTSSQTTATTATAAAATPKPVTAKAAAIEKKTSPPPVQVKHVKQTKNKTYGGLMADDGHDAIGKSLEVTVDVPPVPDYNTLKFAPPVTIQGRTVSMADARTNTAFRRKPPTLEPKSEPKSEPTAELVKDSNQNSLQTEVSPPPPPPPGKLLEKPPHLSHTESLDSISESIQQDQKSEYSEGQADSPTSHLNIPGSFNTQPPAPPLFQHYGTDSTTTASGSRSNNSLIHPPGLTHHDSIPNSVQSQPFFDASEQSLFSMQDESRESFNRSQSSFVVIKPLNVHKKTPSAITVDVDTSVYEGGEVSAQGHQKNKLSLSDEIMRDIQQFEPGFHPNESGSEDDGESDAHGRFAYAGEDSAEVTPVSPLRNQFYRNGDGDDDAERGVRRLKITNFSEDDLRDTTSQPTSEEKNSFPVTENTQTFTNEQRSYTGLFKDTSDSDAEEEKVDKNLDFDDSIYNPTMDHNRLISVSSVGAEVNYDTTASQPQPSRQGDGTDEEREHGTANGFISEAEDSSSIHSAGLVRSNSIKDLSSELGNNSPVELNHGFSFPEQQYVPAQRSGLHVVNDDNDNDIIGGRGGDMYQRSPQLRVTNNDFDFDDDDEQRGIDTEGTQNAHTTFHVVNDGNYRSNDDDQSSTNSFHIANREEQFFNKEYPQDIRINQQQKSLLPRNDDESEEILSFIAKSPIDAQFNFESPSQSSDHHLHHTQFPRNVSDIQLSSSLNSQEASVQSSSPLPPYPPPISNQHLQTGHLSPSQQSTTATATTAANSLTSNYDRRNEPIAPMTYTNPNIPLNKSRRPPPGNESSIATRVARSASVSISVPNVYNSIIREDDDMEDLGTGTIPPSVPKDASFNPGPFDINDSIDASEGIVDVNDSEQKKQVISKTTIGLRKKTIDKVVDHKPQVSSYVELIRFGTKLSNSAVSATKWGLPIGISQTDYSTTSKTNASGGSSTAAAAQPGYKKLRSHKIDLKHGKIKSRLLASEVDDDETTSSRAASSLNLRNSIDESGATASIITGSENQSLSKGQHSAELGGAGGAGFGTSQYSSSIFTSPLSNFNNSTSPRINEINNSSSSSTTLNTGSQLGGSSLGGNSHVALMLPHVSNNNNNNNSGVNRTGTLINHEVAPVLQLGRNGSVRQGGGGMTLFVVNPDNSDSD